MELVENIGTVAIIVTIFVGLLILLGVWFAPLGCWSRLSKIDQRAKYIHENGFESKERSKEILKVQREILAELKKLNEKS